jgi:PAS domain S-box-containing protein
MCRRAEVALREREMHYRQLFELNPAPMLIYERETFHLLLVNEAFERHYGYSRAEAAELTLLDLYPVDERAKRAANFTEIHGTVLASEHHHLKRDGSPITVVAISHDVSIGGHDARFVVFTDITERLRQEAERRELESRLVQSQKMEAVGQLAGGVAHDFNNILTAILVELELLKAEPALSSNLTEGLAELTHEAERAAELTRQLLTFSRRRILKSKVVEIGSVLTNLLKMLCRLIGENIELRYDNSAGPLWLWVDPGLLEQVVVNLVVNARDAMPTGGRLNLRTYAVTVTEPSHEFCHDAYPGHFVCLSVTDNGQGMNEATLQHIFEPFFTTKAAGKGTGLGLATVYGIVKQHRGFLDVRSTPGQGSAFSIFLPALPEGQVLIESPGDHNEVQGGTEDLLLVEDEKTVRHSLCGVLTNLGYRVHEASNSLEALELWDKVNGKIDLLISDIVMPGGLSGIELAVRLMMSSPLLKVLLISGYAPQDADGVLSQRPGIQVLEKPFTASTFALRVRQCLEPRVANDK